MKSAPAGARHQHLQRAARSAGEVFAHPAEVAPAPERSSVALALWSAAGAVALIALYFAF